MVFSSVLFLFLFLPLVLGMYYLLFLPGQRSGVGVRLGNLFLLLSSLVFYAWGEQWFVLLMLGSILLDYVCGLLIAGRLTDWSAPIETLERGGERTRAQKLGLISSLTGNLVALGVFKYFNFAIDNVNAIAAHLDLQWLISENVIQVALPVGISFYTFQSLSYTVDVYRGDARATRNLLNFACFVTLFPQLVAGPIVRYRDLAAQLEARLVGRSDLAIGMSRFVLGLGKKVLIANTVAIAADEIFALPGSELTPGLAWLGALSYHIQIYFDFSAYSDMAIGLGHMFGFKLLENFNYPYSALSVQDFWRRWHMSLSGWFRDYLYIPLGGNRRSNGRTYFNLLTVFILCGLWHGAGWNFIVWGLLHGAALILERVWLGRHLVRWPRPLRNLYMLLVVLFAWVNFRAESMEQVGVFARAMIGFGEGTGELYRASHFFNLEFTCALVFGLVLAFPVLPALLGRFRAWVGDDDSAGGLGLLLGGQLLRAGVLGLIFLASVMSLAAGTHNPFIYFRF